MRSSMLVALGATLFLAGAAAVPASASPLAPIGAATTTTSLADAVAGVTDVQWRRRYGYGYGYRRYRPAYRPYYRPYRRAYRFY